MHIIQWHHMTPFYYYTFLLAIAQVQQNHSYIASSIATIYHWIPLQLHIGKFKLHNKNKIMIMIMIMIKILVKTHPVYRISIKYYCITDNSICSETNSLISLSLSVSVVGHINNQGLLLLGMETACITLIHYFQ